MRAVTVTATGGGSNVKLNALTTFTDSESRRHQPFGRRRFSRLNAYAGGTLQTPALTTLDGVYLDEDSANGITTSQITSLKDGQVDFTGGSVYDLSNVTDLTHTAVNVSGAGRVIALAKASTIDGAIYVAAGAHRIPAAATSYTHAATDNNQVRHFQAVGARQLARPQRLTSINKRHQLREPNSLRGVGRRDDRPEQGHTDRRRQRRRQPGARRHGDRDRAGSNVKLNALTTFTDSYGGDTSLTGDGAFSRLNAYAGGTLQTPALTTLDGVYIDEDAAGAINTSQISSLKDGQVDFNEAVVYDLSNVTDLTHTAITVAGSNRTIAFPNAKTIEAPVSSSRAAPSFAAGSHRL